MTRAAPSSLDAESPPALSLAVGELERVVAPDREEFEARYMRASRPVILTDLTAGWVPPAEWTFDRMATRYGTATVVAAALENGTLSDDPKSGVSFHRVLLQDFVAAAKKGPPGLYVMTPTWNLPAEFQRDYQVPAYCVGAPHMRAKLWLGKAGTVTPTHRDVPHNLHVHLSGRKRWLLFPPGGSAMYPRGLLSGMPNFSQIDPERPDYDRFPRLRGVTALGGTLAPGETLFIPYGWWHHTRTLDDAVSMNFWWGGRVVALASLASTLFKRARGIRRDEWARD